MKWIHGKVKQTANDTQTRVAIPTNLGVVDMRTVWELMAIEAYWTNYAAVSTIGVYSAEFILSAIDENTVFGDTAEIKRIPWGVQVKAAGATPVVQQTIFPFDFLKESELYTPFQFANANLYAGAKSTATGIMVEFDFKLYYEEKKVSELDFLKIQSGYCIC